MVLGLMDFTSGWVHTSRPEAAAGLAGIDLVKQCSVNLVLLSLRDHSTVSLIRLPMYFKISLQRTLYVNICVPQAVNHNK